MTLGLSGIRLVWCWNCHVSNIVNISMFDVGVRVSVSVGVTVTVKM